MATVYINFLYPDADSTVAKSRLQSDDDKLVSVQKIIKMGGASLQYSYTVYAKMHECHDLFWPTV